MMRKLYITRGIPGSGKTTLLNAAGLGPYTLSPDSLRLAMAAPVLGETGEMTISAKNDRKVWELLREMLETRMAKGELIAIDGTHTTMRYYTDYAQLAYRHRYELYIVDLSQVSLEQAMIQNNKREPYKKVSEKTLRRMHQRLTTLNYPKGWKVLRTVQEIQASLEHPVLDFSHYKRVHHIGDIQGCYAPLAEYFNRYPLHDDEAYVFVGDLLDRGRENDKVLDFITRELVDKPNVYFVEGNHDLYIWQWLHDWPVTSREFNGRTRRQLDAAAIDRSKLRALFRSMMPALHYRHGEREVLVTHGGLSTLPKNLGMISARQCIRGVGEYQEVDAIDDAFVQHTAENVYQIHGHRNRQDYPLQYNERCFNLEGKVEFGGSLRTAQLHDNTFLPIEIPNSLAQATSFNQSENTALVRELRNNPLIFERTLPDNISSFHYRPEVMFKKKWTNQTTTTRGLFINTLTNEIVIRAYDKFFNLNEMRQTEYANLQNNLSFPVKAWVKENGYLGLVGYDDSSGDLIIASKTTTEGDFARWFRELFEQKIKANRQYVVDYLRAQNATLLFEVVLPGNDPHIIEYAQDDLILLEIVTRQRTYKTLSDDEREMLGKKLDIRCKQKAATLENWQAFEAWYASVQGMDYSFGNTQIEGFVLEDSAGWHVKIKLDYYTFWKQLRSALDSIKKGREAKIPPHYIYPEEMKKVLLFMQQFQKEQLASLSIGDVRRSYLLSLQ